MVIFFIIIITLYNILGLNELGILRIAGSINEVKKLKDEYNSGIFLFNKKYKLFIR